ncbi:MAG: outer membrane beta-barrel protein [Chitinophagales bacterium]|nr:PorT family protein [Chitinophagales bacterium]MDW8274514.1 outer membrane beta-barrel protein [Chitinophagales bacterium]
MLAKKSLIHVPANADVVKPIIAIIFSLPYLLFAQDKDFFLGAYGSGNASFILNQNNFGTLAPFEQQVVRQSELAYKFTPGWAAGVRLGYLFNRKWGIEGGLHYMDGGQDYEDRMYGPVTIPQGTFGTTGDNRVKVTRDIDLKYIQLLLLGRFSYGERKIKFYLTTGPCFGVRVNGSERVTIAGYEYINDTLNFPFDEKFHRFDFGVSLNSGAEFWINPYCFINLGLHNYCSVLDINSKKMRELNWYSKNDVEYQRSYNFFTGVQVGIHYVFAKRRFYRRL